MVPPAWNQCQASSVRPTFGPHSFAKGEHFGHLPNEFVFGRLANVQGTEEFQAEPAFGGGQDFGAGLEAFEIDGAQFVFGGIGR